MSGTLSRSMAAEIAKKNHVTVLDLLASIHVLHECEKWLGHPYIELQADGSGCATGRDGKTLFVFTSLVNFVEQAEKLMDECDVKWVN